MSMTRSRNWCGLCKPEIDFVTPAKIKNESPIKFFSQKTFLRKFQGRSMSPNQYYIFTRKNTTMLQNKPTLPPLGWLKGLILRIKNEFLAKLQFFAIFCNRSFVFSHYFQTTFFQYL